MSEVKDAGGPAFPMPGVLIESVSGILSRISDKKTRDDAMEQLGERATGMTLRDYFAAKAMQGYIVGTERPIFHKIAEVAYEMADAMLEARK